MMTTTFFFQILIESVVKHEKYVGPQEKYKNDIALIRLAKPAQINQSVRPICLPINEDKLKDAFQLPDLVDGLVSEVTDTTIIGWGKVAIQDRFDASVSNFWVWIRERRLLSSESWLD